jgi:hypothetical protein
VSLAVEGHRWIAGIIRRRSILPLKALPTCPTFDERPVHVEVFAATQVAARLRQHEGEECPGNNSRHSRSRFLGEGCR